MNLPIPERSTGALRPAVEAADQPTEHTSDAHTTLRRLAWLPSSGESSPATPTIVLLHGLGDSADIWRPMMAAWQAPLPVLAMDLPGHGRSPWLRGGVYEISDLARAVASQLIQWGVHRPILVGHSLGAKIAAELASCGTFALSGTILVDIGARSADIGRKAIEAHLDALLVGAPTREGLMRQLVQRLPMADPRAVAIAVWAIAAESGGRWRMPFDPAIKTLMSRGRDAEEIWEVLARVGGPIALIRGAYSGVLDRDTAARVMETLAWRPAILEIVENAGHAIPLEQPLALGVSIGKCLRSLGLIA